MVLDNTKNASFIPTSLELAKRISRANPRPRWLKVIAKGKVGKAVDSQHTYSPKNLYITLSSIEVNLPDGTLVGRKNL